MITHGTEDHPSPEDRIVAEFGDGYHVDGIAARHGLTVAQVYAVVRREVGPDDRRIEVRPSPYQPPDEDAVVAEYGAGNDVALIARKHGISAEQVYAVVQRVVQNDW